MEKFSNKKIIISLLVIGVVVGGAIYIYRKNKKKTETGDTDTGKMTTEKDALEMADVLSKKEQPVPIIFMKKFVDLYTKNISKDLHKTLLVVASKKESEWTTQEKLDMSILINKVFLPLSTEIGQPK
jgi:hypothetical protein